MNLWKIIEVDLAHLVLMVDEISQKLKNTYKMNHGQVKYSFEPNIAMQYIVLASIIMLRKE